MKPKSIPTDEPVPAPEATPPTLPHKLGANHGDPAKKARKRDNNFKQSCDLREDRGIRQMKTNPKGRS